MIINSYIDVVSIKCSENIYFCYMYLGFLKIYRAYIHSSRSVLCHFMYFKPYKQAFETIVVPFVQPFQQEIKMSCRLCRYIFLTKRIFIFV